jgi:hypothetical protein
MRWAGHVVSMGKRGINVRFRWGSQKERDHYEDVNADRMITLKWIFEK